MGRIKEDATNKKGPGDRAKQKMRARKTRMF